jgi:hypothetical protein
LKIKKFKEIKYHTTFKSLTTQFGIKIILKKHQRKIRKHVDKKEKRKTKLMKILSK